MQIKLNQLGAHLKKKLAPIYLISGDVPLLVRETRELLRKAANTAGYSQRELLCIEPGFDWSRFLSLTENFSLFSEKCLIEIHNPTTKFDESGIKTLLQYLDAPNPDKLIVITTNKLTSAQQKARWYKAINNAGITIPIWPISARELPQWIQQRIQQAGLHADMESVHLLANQTEGNLLATQQAIEKLQLLFPKQMITIKEMSTALCDNARFNVFDLVNYALFGEAARVVRIVTGLRDEGIEPTFVLWALARECRNLINKAQLLQQGLPMNQVLRGEWASRQALLKSALSRLDLKTLQQSLQFASQIDQIIKGVKPGDVWNSLTQLGLALCNKNPLPIR